MSEEKLRRWRLILGGEQADGTGLDLAGADLAVDRTLGALYEPDRKGGLGSSAPSVTRWLEDVRKYFPSPVVRVLQRDALERLDLKRMLLERELLEAAVPDVHLVTQLLALASVIPARTRETARQVVARVVEEVQRRLAEPLRQAVGQALDRAARGRRPHQGEVDWNRTILANLKHYQPRHRTVIPEVLVGYARRRPGLRDLVLCIDQSGSMASSVVYAGILGSVLATLPSLRTRLFVFDTAIADLSEHLHDPVELLFGAQLGGGTDIGQALGACQAAIARPEDTVLVLITDLYDGGGGEEMMRRAAELVAAGVTLVVLLALSDEGAPSYDHDAAAAFASLGAPVFACTPDLFPDLIAAAIQKRDLGAWAAAWGIVTAAARPRT